MNKSQFRFPVASLLIASMLALPSLPAAAIDSDCVPAPQLTQIRKTESMSLGSETLAQAWRWMPGYDSQRAKLSDYGTKVSVVSGNLRNIDFGLLYSNIPKSADLRTLNYTSGNALASINGDYMDGNGPWSAMIEGNSVVYAPPVSSGVVGMTQERVNPAKGYRVKGKLVIGKKSLAITGVNQPSPGANSAVVYQSSFFQTTPAKGEATLLIRNNQIFRVYPTGFSLAKNKGLIIQVRGSQAAFARTLKPKTSVKLVLPQAPEFETRMAADMVAAVGAISTVRTTLTFDSVNYGYLSASGATLFDDNFSEVTRSGRVTIRITPDTQGRLIVRNVYRQGYFTRVDPGGLVIQVNGPQVNTALNFRVGDVVTVSKGYRAQSKKQFVNAAGRGPKILQNGKFTWICANHSNEYRPRSAIGWNNDGQVWLITSSRGEDARDNGMRMGGSTTDQMGLWLLNLGATDAVLLDGGGSTTMEVNSPEDGWKRFDLPDAAWYRPLANAFALFSRN